MDTSQNKPIVVDIKQEPDENIDTELTLIKLEAECEDGDESEISSASIKQTEPVEFMKTELPVDDFLCDVCEETFELEEDLSNHKLKSPKCQDEDFNIKDEPKDEIENIYICSVCNGIHESKEELIDHKKENDECHEHKKCDKCGGSEEDFSCTWELKDHLKATHGMTDQDTDGPTAGPSMPKRRRTDWEQIPPAADESEDEFIEPFSDSVSEFHDSELDSGSELSENASGDDDMLGDNSFLASEVQNGENYSNNVWVDVPGLKDIPFTGNSGIIVPIPGNEPHDYFSLLITDDFLLHIVEQTNIHAEEVFLSTNTRKRSLIINWKPLTLSEFKIFLGLFYHMGNIQINRVRDYWRTDELFSIPCFRKYMSRNRFLLIMRCLQFDQISDGFQKIKHVQNYFNRKMAEIYYPSRDLILDSMIWAGRRFFGQYIKGKNRYGTKLYVLRQTNGLILRAKVYTRAEGDLGGPTHAEKVVVALLQGLENHGHSIYMDKLYNSYSLSLKLLDQGFYVTGPLRKDMIENPKQVVNAILKKGEIKTLYCNGVAISKWRGKREVLHISTEIPNKMVEIQRRKGTKVSRPLAIHNYNQMMSGVDKQDQLLSYYSCESMTLPWHKKLGLYFLSMLLLNSHFLFGAYSDNSMNYYDFRMAIIRNLLAEKPQPVQRSDKGPSISNHLPYKYIGADGRRLRKRCKVCSAKKIRKSSPYYCPSCPNTPGLCVGKCFQDYHKT